jgi:hypothetical protein
MTTNAVPAAPHATALKAELAEMLADSKVYDGTARAARQEMVQRYRGSTREFLRKAVDRRMGGQSMPLPYVG